FYAAGVEVTVQTLDDQGGVDVSCQNLRFRFCSRRAPDEGAGAGNEVDDVTRCVVIQIEHPVADYRQTVTLCAKEHFSRQFCFLFSACGDEVELKTFDADNSSWQRILQGILFVV